MAQALYLGMETTDMKLVSAAIVAVALSLGLLGEREANCGYTQAERGAANERIIERQSDTQNFQSGTINEKTALADVSLRMNEGDFITIIGNNGAGKSTLLNCIAGVFPIDSGSITGRQGHHQRAGIQARQTDRPRVSGSTQGYGL